MAANAIYPGGTTVTMADMLRLPPVATPPAKPRTRTVCHFTLGGKDLGKVGRNKLCPCGKGRKFKHCCMPR